MADKTAAALAAGSMPDVFTFYNTTDVARPGFTLDLSPYFKRDQIDPASVWFPISLNRITYNGKYYAVPRDVGPAGIAYNNDIFDKYGGAYPGANCATTDFAGDLKKLNHIYSGSPHNQSDLIQPALEQAWTDSVENHTDSIVNLLKAAAALQAQLDARYAAEQ